MKFNGKDSNLHGLWDSDLISREGKSYDQMAIDYDTATPADIKQWQKEAPMQWLWASYQFSAKLYEDVEKNNKLDDEYYKANVQIVQHRIEMAGIRLARALNKIFAEYPVSGIVTHFGTYQRCGRTLERMGEPRRPGLQLQKFWRNDPGQFRRGFPNQLLTIVLKEGTKNRQLNSKTVSVKGRVIDYKGKPEIEVTGPQQLQYWIR